MKNYNGFCEPLCLYIKKSEAWPQVTRLIGVGEAGRASPKRPEKSHFQRWLRRGVQTCQIQQEWVPYLPRQKALHRSESVHFLFRLCEKWSFSEEKRQFLFLLTMHWLANVFGVTSCLFSLRLEISHHLTSFAGSLLLNTLSEES